MQVSPLSGQGMGPYPGDYGQAFAFCKILYPLAWGTDCSGPRPTRLRLPESRKGATPGNGRAYPVHDGTRGAVHPPCP